MSKLVRANQDQITKYGSNKQINPYSGKEIMDFIVTVARKATANFDLSMLGPDFMYPHAFRPKENTFEKYVYKILEASGKVEDLASRGYFEAPHGRIVQHHNLGKLGRFTKSDIEHVLDNLVVLDEGLWDSVEDEDLLGVEYHIHFPWSTNISYFLDDDVSDWLEGKKEELGFSKVKIPESIIAALSKAYNFREKFSGKRELKETAREIQDLCTQINSDEFAVVDSSEYSGDLFSYDGHVFYFRRDYGEQRNNCLTDLGTSHRFDYPRINWAYALYNRREEKPIAYVMFKSNEEVQRKLIL